MSRFIEFGGTLFENCRDFGEIKWISDWLNYHLKSFGGTWYHCNFLDRCDSDNSETESPDFAHKTLKRSDCVHCRYTSAANFVRHSNLITSLVHQKFFRSLNQVELLKYWTSSVFSIFVPFSCSFVYFGVLFYILLIDTQPDDSIRDMINQTKSCSPCPTVVKRLFKPDTKRGSTSNTNSNVKFDRLENDLNKDFSLIHFQLPTNNHYESGIMTKSLFQTGNDRRITRWTFLSSKIERKIFRFIYNVQHTVCYIPFVAYSWQNDEKRVLVRHQKFFAVKVFRRKMLHIWYWNLRTMWNMPTKRSIPSVLNHHGHEQLFLIKDLSALGAEYVSITNP